jgi:hypothetical protein
MVGIGVPRPLLAFADDLIVVARGRLLRSYRVRTSIEVRIGSRPCENVFYSPKNCTQPGVIHVGATI